MNLLYFPFTNLQPCFKDDVIGLNSLPTCWVDLAAKVMKNANKNATQAVLNTSETRTARIDFVNIFVALVKLVNCVGDRTG